ncbi:MAG: M48 family metalloprotease [Gammaproteobacteria bacterium]|nr:M48 family metalloprotease [Gammaproteobacteria bacterium]
MKPAVLPWFAALLSALIGLTGCAGRDVRTLEQSSDTRQLTEDESRRWYSAEELDRTWRQKGLIYTDDALTAYLQSVADALYPEFSDTVVIRVMDSPDLNAFALPNGSVYLNLGIIARMENEAQLATVIAHEISHFKFQHSLKQRHAIETAVVTGWSVSILTGIPLSGELLALGAMSGYSQEAEREADREGFRRLVRQGYDGTESVKIFAIMQQEAKVLDSREPWFYSSHPRLSERIESMQQLNMQREESGGATNQQSFAAMTGRLHALLLEKYLVARQYKQLINLLEEKALRSRYPVYADFYLGEAYLQRKTPGDAERAQAAYLSALERAPEFAPSYRALGLIHMQQKQQADALRYFDKYLQLNPHAEDKKYIELYRNRLLEGS